MVGRLIAVRILADQPRDVTLVPAGKPARTGKHAVEEMGIGVRTSHQRHVTGHIVGHEEIVLPTIGLGVFEGHLGRVVHLTPCRPVSGLDESARGIVQVLPTLGAAPEALRDVHPSHVFRHAGNARVVKGVFEGFRHTFTLPLQGQIAEAVPDGLGQVIGSGHRHHRLERSLFIEPVQPLGPCVGDDRNCMVTDHATRVVPCQFPHGQFAALAVHADEIVDEHLRTFRFQDVQQGMGGPKRVP